MTENITFLVNRPQSLMACISSHGIGGVKKLKENVKFAHSVWNATAVSSHLNFGRYIKKHPDLYN